MTQIGLFLFLVMPPKVAKASTYFVTVTEVFAKITLPEQEQQSRDGKFGTSLNGFSTSSALSSGQDKLRRRRTSISR